MLFRDKTEAGRILADRLAAYANYPDTMVLALPRGGVPVAFEVAEALNLPLDIFVVRKLGLPGHEEFAIGAIASGGARVLNQDLIRQLSLSDEIIEHIVAREQRELERRERTYRGQRPMLDVRDRTIIIIDDGLATGSSMRAAIAALRQKRPAKLIVAVPVGARMTCSELEALADEVICLETPENFSAVGLWYRDFSQTTDEEVIDLLERNRKNSEARNINQEAGL
ncbi:phosphoribosyltransferase [Methylobacter svalbardensis]|uniref:phosphoribosyltransferase n=1 Tax=Methylobacter svalbardensis TaxID=3080016 RepID=UPI0030ED315D